MIIFFIHRGQKARKVNHKAYLFPLYKPLLQIRLNFPRTAPAAGVKVAAAKKVPGQLLEIGDRICWRDLGQVFAGDEPSEPAAGSGEGFVLDQVMQPPGAAVLAGLDRNLAKALVGQVNADRHRDIVAVIEGRLEAETIRHVKN